jgi:hypothetical protein
MGTEGGKGYSGVGGGGDGDLGRRVWASWSAKVVVLRSFYTPAQEVIVLINLIHQMS